MGEVTREMANDAIEYLKKIGVKYPGGCVCSYLYRQEIYEIYLNNKKNKEDGKMEKRV